MKVHHWEIAGGLVALCCALAAPVQAETVLERVSAGGKLVIAHRESSVPFSYIDTQSGKPVGYAVDLCLRMAEVVRKKTGKKDMEVQFLQVTAANRLTKEGMTMMCVTHEMGFARKVASRVIFIDVGGKILEDCSKEEFFGNPDARQPRTKDFLNKILQH